MGQLENTIAELKGAYHQIDKRMGDLRSDVSALRCFVLLDKRLESRFLWTIGISMTSWVTIMAAIFPKH
jgi:hypothetical protein